MTQHSRCTMWVVFSGFCFTFFLLSGWLEMCFCMITGRLSPHWTSRGEERQTSMLLLCCIIFSMNRRENMVKCCLFCILFSCYMMNGQDTVLFTSISLLILSGNCQITLTHCFSTEMPKSTPGVSVLTSQMIKSLEGAKIERKKHAFFMHIFISNWHFVTFF